jgi:hypothetical protein
MNELDGPIMNEKWIQDNPNHYLALTSNLHKDKNLFIHTCCEITVEALKKKYFGDKFKWELISNFDLNYESFWITFGESYDNIEHTLLIHDNHIFQSYFNQYSLKIIKFTDKYKEYFLNNNLEKIQNIKLNPNNNLHKYFIWAPKRIYK